MAKKSTRPRQERGKRTRENIILCTIDALIASNVHGLRFSHIAKLADVPQPLLDYHFPSMEALLMEVTQFQIEKLKLLSLEAIQANASKPRKMLEAYIRSPFELSAKDKGFSVVWSAFYHLANTNKEFADFNAGVIKIGQERIAAMIGAIIQAEKRKNKTSLIMDTAFCVQGNMSGYCALAASQSQGDLMAASGLAVKASFQLLEANFPAA